MFKNQLKINHIKTVFISVIFRENQIFFRWWGKWFLNRLKGVSKFFVQNNQSKDILTNHGITSVQVVGDTRFDAVLETQKLSKKNKLIEAFIKNKKCIVFGSTWNKDHDLIIQFIKSFAILTVTKASSPRGPKGLPSSAGSADRFYAPRSLRDGAHWCGHPAGRGKRDQPVAHNEKSG